MINLKESRRWGLPALAFGQSREPTIQKIKSGSRDLNPGPQRPERCALANCATSRVYQNEFNSKIRSYSNIVECLRQTNIQLKKSALASLKIHAAGKIKPL